MRLLFIVIAVLAGGIAQAGELEQAYQKEYAYLVSEKKALEQRLKEMHKSQKSNIEKVSKEIDILQSTFLEKQNLTDRLNLQIVDATRNVDFSANDDMLLDTTINQATESLKKTGVNKIDEKLNAIHQLEVAFSTATEVVSRDGKVFDTSGRFYLANGEARDGNIINIGRVAKYGLSSNGGGALAPAGDGQFRVWDGESRNTAEQLADKLYPDKINIFLYENAEKSIEKKEEKTFSDDVKAGGMVGKVIILLGIIGLCLVIFRIIMLGRAGSNVQKVSHQVNEQVAAGNMDGALQTCKENINAASKVIAATLRNLKRDRDHIEDIISEAILHESSYIDRFGSAILVIAAISPLLGLLGTVTGMISTFDIITEFGTGDPKLLSSGISEALLTTKFGLVVAIPLLLVGNLLSSWARQIKNDLEQAALHMINTHKM